MGAEEIENRPNEEKMKPGGVLEVEYKKTVFLLRSMRKFLVEESISEVSAKSHLFC